MDEPNHPVFFGFDLARRRPQTASNSVTDSVDLSHLNRPSKIEIPGKILATAHFNILVVYKWRPKAILTGHFIVFDWLFGLPKVYFYILKQHSRNNIFSLVLTLSPSGFISAYLFG